MSDDNTKRHWHGSPGDRHEHTNVWMSGGAKAPTTRAAWAMMPGMETRRDSSSSTTSNGNKQAEDTSPTLPTVNERRRSSASSSNTLFSNLHSQKRDSTDPDMATRRASWNEQAAKGGFLSKWWDGYTRGSPNK